MRWLACCVLACVCAAGMAQSANDAEMKARLEQVASSYTPNHQFMGTVLVVRGSDVLLNKGYGMASLEWQIPNEPDAKFRLGSLTKQFTATLVLTLEQEGKLSVNDPVSKYLPDAPKAWEKIKLANLLGHIAAVGAEIEFVPGANGAMDSVILHQGGANMEGKKK